MQKVRVIQELSLDNLWHLQQELGVDFDSFFKIVQATLKEAFDKPLVEVLDYSREPETYVEWKAMKDTWEITVFTYCYEDDDEDLEI